MVLSIPKPLQLLQLIRSIGKTTTMQPYEVRRLGVFNLINFFGACTGLVIPFAGFNDDATKLPLLAWVVAFSPFVISSIVLVANYLHQHKFATLWYLLTYPFITALLYIADINVGIELFFILYGVLAIFFLDKVQEILGCTLYILLSYVFVVLLHKKYTFQLEEVNFTFYIFNHLLSVVFIFVGLLLIKKENNEYQNSLLEKGLLLEEQNAAIQHQANLLESNSEILKSQGMALTNLNNLKDKLFSIIGHDLRTPIYGLKNLFTNVQQYNLPGEAIKELLPEIVSDLHYTTSLMENLLLWAKSQMNGSNTAMQVLDTNMLMDYAQKLFRLQAENKKISIVVKNSAPSYVYADKDRIELVLRNLVSNAIKFTPENGIVTIICTPTTNAVVIEVADTGVGITEDAKAKIFSEDFYTTKGTAKENGTGLGLKLCKEFLLQNDSKLEVRNNNGQGTVFYFSLPKA